MNKSIGPIIFIAVIAFPLWVWFGWRIEPANGEIAIRSLSFMHDNEYPIDEETNALSIDLDED